VVFIHSGILISHKKNEILSFSGKWLELENIIICFVRLRRPKIVCSPSYADDRLKTNIATILDKDNKLRGDLAQEG
jgi:hypothetical protein